jgi:hypothetical protein
MKVHTGKGQVGYDLNSAMISGGKDMLVIDAQFSLSEAHKLAAEILRSKKNLTLIYATHRTPTTMTCGKYPLTSAGKTTDLSPKLRNSGSRNHDS